MTRFVFALGMLSLASAASAQRCPQPPGEPTDAPWPDVVQVPSMEVGEPSTIELTRAEGEAIRCAIQRRLRRAVRDVPSDLRDGLVGHRLGHLWMDGDHPRIGAFFLQRDHEGNLELSDTLAVGAAVRITLVVRFEPRRGRWRMSHIGARTDHRRRGRPAAAAP